MTAESIIPPHPDWYRKLTAYPEAIIEIGTETFPVRPTIAEWREWQRSFNIQTTLIPFFATYQQQMTHQIPVIIFERG